MRAWIGFAAAAALLAGCGQNAGGAGGAGGGAAGGPRQQVWAAGSSTVFPFATRVAENVARTTGGSPAKVESLGTGGGIKLFCSGTGSSYPDIANASRPMKKSEFEACAANGVNDVVEIKIGFDGIVIANALNGATYDLSEEEIFRALAADLPTGEGFAPNPNKTWADVDKTLPAERIQVYGPPPTSGTRDAFVELGMEGGAVKIPQLAELKKSDSEAFTARAHTIRSDGAWTDSGENDNAIVQTLTKTPGSLGVFGYSFLENNADQVKPATINGVKPTHETIADGSYPLARSLYIYVKKGNIGVTPGLREYVAAFVSDAATGKGGYLLERGLIPLPADQHAAMKTVAETLPVMAAPER
ncbi:MAG: substrate-binding domain-containing protein [Phenylobacterium sp.]|uniref:substrate-binding domain-containing protein n=1 Tax=Phenylobacterium sp. TaxID=1871053 RepID=UPI00391CC798